MKRKRREARQLDLFAETRRQPMPCAENVVSAWRRFDPAQKADPGTIVLNMNPADAWFYTPVQLELPEDWCADRDERGHELIRNEHHAGYGLQTCVDRGWIRVIG